MSTYACHVCRADIHDIDKRTHSRSEWHIYNLKRLVASLPPLSHEQFQKKKEVLVAIGAGREDNVSKAKKKLYCEPCRKTFISVKSYDNHIKSRNHNTKLRDSQQGSGEHGESNLTTVADLESNCADDADHETVDEKFRQPLPVGACLFCDKSFVDLPTSEVSVLNHMELFHNFVLPFSDKLVDARGLLSELGRLVGEEYACLGCGRQFFGRRQNRDKCSPMRLRQEALKALRMHMIDKRHNFLYIGEEDPVVVALAVAENEGEDGDSLPLSARIGGELYNRFYAPDRANRTLVLPDTEDGGEEVYEVRLPTGGIMGHRNYQIAYRQNTASFLCEEAKRRRYLALTSSGEDTKATNKYGRWAITCLASRTSRREAFDRSRETATGKQNLKLAMSGNYFLREHLRRQY